MRRSAYGFWSTGIGRAAYNIPVALRLRGPLNVAALKRSVAALIQRHESMRTRFESVEGAPIQVIDPPGPFAWVIRDLAALPRARSRAAVQAIEPGGGTAAVRFSARTAVRPLLCETRFRKSTCC